MKDIPGASLSDSCGLRYLSSLQPRFASTPESCVAPCSISQNPSPGSQIPSNGTSRNSSAIRPHNGRTRTSSCHSTGQLVADLEVLQICEAFGANRYPFPEEPQRQQQMNSEVNSRLRELHSTIDAGEPQSHDSISLKVPRSPGPTAMAAAAAGWTWAVLLRPAVDSLPCLAPPSGLISQRYTVWATRLQQSLAHPQLSVLSTACPALQAFLGPGAETLPLAKISAAKSDNPQLSVLRPAGERHRSALLQNIAGSLEAWTLQVKREKGVYHTLNKLSVDVTRKVCAFVGSGSLFCLCALSFYSVCCRGQHDLAEVAGALAGAVVAAAHACLACCCCALGPCHWGDCLDES